MSVGHERQERKTPAQVFGALGTGDTSELYGEPFTVIVNRDIPYAGGNSVDRKRVYIDQTLYREVMAGKVEAGGLSPQQLIDRWVDHEHTEKAVDDGDNPYDDYLGAHGIATGKEESPIDNPDAYEKAIQPALDECIERFLKLGDKANPPKDLWCGPYVDDEDAEDKKILKILQAKGVKDAFKVSKSSAHYGMGGVECKDCKHYAPTISQDNGKIGDCEHICGLVRWDRACDWWEAKKGYKDAKP